MKQDCTNTVVYFKEQKRMCNDHKSCTKCGIYNIDTDLTCAIIQRFYPDACVKVVQAYSDGNPELTYMDDFYKKHPDAPRCPDGRPQACAFHCGYIKVCPNIPCNECWRVINKK